MASQNMYELQNTNEEWDKALIRHIAIYLSYHSILYYGEA